MFSSKYRRYDPLDWKFRSLYHHMPYCAVLGCGNDSRDGNIDSSITFHSFPNDKKRRRKWIKATGRQYWNPRCTSRICSVHFKSKMFVVKYDGTRRIRPTALPTLKVFAYDYDEEDISDSDENDEPSTSTDSLTNKETVNNEVSQDDEDDDIICLESSPAKKPKINNPAPESNTPRLGIVRDVAALKDMKKKIPLETRNATHKMGISNDEFQLFAYNMAAQLRNLPLDVALNLQTEIHKLVVKERTELYRMSKKHSVDESSAENNV